MSAARGWPSGAVTAGGPLDDSGGQDRSDAGGTAPAAPTTVTVLVAVICLLGAFASAVGAFASGGPGPHAVTGLHGGRVTLYGQGLYRYDTLLIGAGNRGQDLVVLFVEVPLLAGLLAATRRGGLRSRLMLASTLAFFAYYYTSMCFATAFNRLFAVYVVLFAASLAALLLTLLRLDPAAVAAGFPDRPAPGSLAAYLLSVAALLTAVWLPPMLRSLITATVPTFANTYTSEVTWALDLGLIVPAAVTAAVLLLRRRPAGYLLTFLLIGLNLTIGAVLISQGIAQVLAHALTTTEVLGMVVTFAVLTLVAAGLLAALLRRWQTSS